MKKTNREQELRDWRWGGYFRWMFKVGLSEEVTFKQKKRGVK